MHAENCAVYEDGPCTCGAEEILQDLQREDADLDEEE
jgi:hypothetical protein